MIRVSNTGNSCLLTLRAKGYELTLWFTKDAEGDYRSNWDAEKNGKSFSSTTPEELLGLVAMWEFRGDDWETRHDEPNVFDELYPSAITYDQDGNVIEIGDEDIG